MKQIQNLVLSLLFLTVFGCSDGGQIGQKINQLVEEKKIEYIIIQSETKNGQIQRKEITIDENTFENQFIRFEDEYINMGRIRTIKIIGNKIEVNL